MAPFVVGKGEGSPSLGSLPLPDRVALKTVAETENSQPGETVGIIGVFANPGKHKETMHRKLFQVASSDTIGFFSSST